MTQWTNDQRTLWKLLKKILKKDPLMCLSLRICIEGKTQEEIEEMFPYGPPILHVSKENKVYCLNYHLDENCPMMDDKHLDNIIRYMKNKIGIRSFTSAQILSLKLYERERNRRDVLELNENKLLDVLDFLEKLQDAL